MYACLTELLSIVDEQGATAIDIFFVFCFVLTLLVSLLLFYLIFLYRCPFTGNAEPYKAGRTPSGRGPELLLTAASQRTEISASSHVCLATAVWWVGVRNPVDPPPPSLPFLGPLPLSFPPSSSPTPFSNLRPKLSRNGGDVVTVLLLSRNGGDVVTVLLLSRNGGDVATVLLLSRNGLSERW